MRIKGVLLIPVFAFSLFANAITFTLTNTETGPTNIALGYQVPQPVDSLTPVIGFRSYASLSQRHLQMSLSSNLISQIQIGETINARPIYAYQIGDDDQQLVSGGVEGAALINSGIHAREWQTPEATTALIEHLFDNQGDQHVAQYLLENLNLVVIPVLNIDGFLQTQRFASQVTDSTQSPRDGRMRRKNMRDVDENLDTLNDNLGGIDLNRNNNPYWATSDRSESTIDSIVYHGTGPASEPETQALQQAALTAGEDRLRFYIDTHSFSQIYFSPYTNNTRRNDLNDRVATIMRTPNNFKYRYGPSSSGRGIGSTDEYFANTYHAVSYTLEIEPLNSATEYGGFGVSHDGFILPNAEVPRMREETRKATIAGLYTISEVPILKSLEIRSESDQSIAYAANWQTQGSARVLDVTTSGTLSASTRYIAKLTFNKPMRALENGQVTNLGSLSGTNGVVAKLVGQLNNSDIEYDFDANQGVWLVNQGFSRYKADSFEVSFTLPAGFDWNAHSRLALSIETTDMVGQKLDTNPATIVDWQTGAWTNYEDVLGNPDSDNGGASVALRLIDDGSDLYQPSNPPTPPTPTPPTPTPPAPTPGNSGGGGSIFWLLLLIIGGCSGRLITKTPT